MNDKLFQELADGLNSQPNSQNSSQVPQDVSLAQSDVGDQSYNHYCQQFVEQVAYNKTGMFPSAIDAWNNYSQSGQAQEGTKGIQPGDIIYFSPNDSNQGYGHTGIYTGKDSFISATDNGVANQKINDWQNMTGQQVLGYVKNPDNLPHIGGIQ